LRKRPPDPWWMAVIAASSRGFGFQAGQSQVMGQVVGHLPPINTLEMRPGDDSGSQGPGGAEEHLIDEGALAGQDDRQIGFGILIELSEEMEFSEDLQTEEGGLIDDQDRFNGF
jgi:hypothetical protein